MDYLFGNRDWPLVEITEVNQFKIQNNKEHKLSNLLKLFDMILLLSCWPFDYAHAILELLLSSVKLSMVKW